jgi:hypothetical protein
MTNAEYVVEGNGFELYNTICHWLTVCFAEFRLNKNHLNKNSVMIKSARTKELYLLALVNHMLENKFSSYVSAMS